MLAITISSPPGAGRQPVTARRARLLGRSHCASSTIAAFGSNGRVVHQTPQSSNVATAAAPAGEPADGQAHQHGTGDHQRHHVADAERMALEEGVPRQRRDAEPGQRDQGAGRQAPLATTSTRATRRPAPPRAPAPPNPARAAPTRPRPSRRPRDADRSDRGRRSRRSRTRRRPSPCCGRRTTAAPPPARLASRAASSSPRPTPAPSRHRATTVAASSAPATGHASYRVINASASARRRTQPPPAGSVRRAPRSVHHSGEADQAEQQRLGHRRRLQVQQVGVR